MASTIEIILKGTDQASKTFKALGKTAQETFKDMLKVTADATKAVAGVGVAMKKAFDLGREGAVIEQTAESFDFLMDKIGAAPDLMDQLTAASNRTISSVELQSSTMTLLAGASGELATALANSTPRLLEIAKAANKLNPALGTTSFMYESIATGVKRAQPLILDNLGLTLKVGEANKAYAASIGKSVEEMTSQDRAMAILNATLEAGDTLIKQVGGDTVSATDEFDQMNVSIKESVDEIKKALVPALKDAAKAINLILTGGGDMKELFKTHAKEVLEAGESWEFFRDETQRVADVMNQEMLPWGDELLDFYRMLGVEVQENIIWSDEMARAMFIQAQETENLRVNHFQLIDTYVETSNKADVLASNQIELAFAMGKVGSEAANAALKSKDFLDEIDRQIDSPVANFIQDMEWFLATGGRFEAEFAKIKRLALVAPEAAYQAAQDLYGTIIDSQEELNMIDASKAAENLQSTLGWTAKEARDYLAGTDGFEAALARIDGIQHEFPSLVYMNYLTEQALINLGRITETDWGDIRIGFAYSGQPPGNELPSTGTRGGGGGGGGSTPPYEPGESPRGGNQQYITQNFNVDSMLDIEEIAARLSEY